MKKIALILQIILIMSFSTVFNMPEYKKKDSLKLNDEAGQSYVSQNSIKSYKSLRNVFSSETNILYSYSTKDSSGVEMHDFDIYTPYGEPPQNGFPTVITIHGGAFTMGEKEDYDYITPIMIENGCIHISMNYRLITKTPSSNANYYLDMLDDISSLVNHIYENSSLYKIDVNKIIIMGYSAGGNLALMYGLKNYVYEDIDNPENNIPFKGIITEGAPMFTDLMIKNGIVYHDSSSYVQAASIHNELSALLCKDSFTYSDLEIINPLSLSSYKCKNVKLVQGTDLKYKNSDLYDNDEGDMLVPLIDALNLKARIDDEGCEVVLLQDCSHAEYPIRLMNTEYYFRFVSILNSIIDGEE